MTVRSARASAPGKTILMGEHSAVLGGPALVAAIDRRLEVEIRNVGTTGVVLDLADLEVTTTVAWHDILSYAARARELWHEYRQDPRAETLAAVVGGDPTHLVKVALGEAANSRAGVSLEGARVVVRSKIPVGSGFGSSAAVAAAVSAAYFETSGLPVDLDQLRRVTLEIEKRQHGMPSGIDNACVVNGGVLWCERTETGELRTRDHRVPARRMNRFRLLDTGRPRENTGQVVAAARRRFEAKPQLVDRMMVATDRFADALRSTRQDGSIEEQIREFQDCLEHLAIVPKPVQRVVRLIEDCGGAAKISGAGTLSGDSAGALLVYHREPAVLEQQRSLAHLMDPTALGTIGAGGLGTNGVESESMS